MTYLAAARMTPMNAREAKERAERAWPLRGELFLQPEFYDFEGPKINYEVPGPPVAKGRPRMTKNGHVYTPLTTKSYESIARHAAEFAVSKSHWPRGGWQSNAVRYVVQIDLWLAQDRGDGDNFCKGLLDSANGVVWPDDGRICAKFIKRRIAHGCIVPHAEVFTWAVSRESLF